MIFRRIGIRAWHNGHRASSAAAPSQKGTTVLGTATAASLWATGAIGVSVGLGSFDVAVTVAVSRS